MAEIPGQGRNLTVDGLTPAYIRELIGDLERAADQLERIGRGEGWDLCAVCEDNDHHAGECWYHNTALLAQMGRYALAGTFWRCFHCGAVFTDEASAERHFGRSEVEAAVCLLQFAAFVPGAISMTARLAARFSIDDLIEDDHGAT